MVKAARVVARRSEADLERTNGIQSSRFLRTAYDAQKIKRMHAAGMEGTEEDRKAAVLGALALYLDFINLFFLLLRLFGRKKVEDGSEGRSSVAFSFLNFLPHEDLLIRQLLIIRDFRT